MPRIFACYHCVIVAVMMAFISTAALGQVDKAALQSALKDQIIRPEIELGAWGYRMPQRASLIDNQFPVATTIYPDGHHDYKNLQDYGFFNKLNPDEYVRAKYDSFPPGYEFKISIAQPRDGGKVHDIELLLNPLPGDPQSDVGVIGVYIVLDPGYLKTMSNNELLKIIDKYLVIESLHPEMLEAWKEAAATKQKAEEAAAAIKHKVPPALLAKAQAGDAEAQYEVGRIFSAGESGVEKDDVAAFHWFKRSAEQNNPKGENAVGVSYEGGNGVAKDYAQALVWLRKAAAQGDAKGENNLGEAYYRGWGVAKDFSQALDWYQKSAAQGNSLGEAWLGYMYASGQGVEQDFQEARAWYRKAAEQGSDWAQNSLGVLYENSQGVAQDNFTARSWFLEAAKQGNKEAKANLATLPKAAW